MAIPQMGHLRFDPPGPGSWVLDPVHFPRPVTPYWEETQPKPFKEGFRQTAEYYGLAIEGMQFGYVNGFAYRSIMPIPAELLPQRAARCEEVFAGKLWRQQVQEWDDLAKPTSIQTHQRLQRVDPDTLSYGELIGYLGRCRDHHAAMIRQHRRFTGAATIPTGDLLVHVTEWTGLPQAEILAMLKGASPVSGGGSPELNRLVAAISQDAAAARFLESDNNPRLILDGLGSGDGEVPEALSGYLNLVGYRLLDGFDISGPYALELPDVLLRAIRSWRGSRQSSDNDTEDRIADIRRQVPEKHRGQFDELLGEALFTYRIRDERGVFSDVWAAGIMRRAMLSAGRRLAQRGLLEQADHVIAAGFEEVRLMLSPDAAGPSDERVAERFEYLFAHTAKEAPTNLGPPVEAPDWTDLPRSAARMMQAMKQSTDSLWATSNVPHEEYVLKGLAASGGVCEGPARLVTGPIDFDRIVHGDVLITEATTEAFNILLPLLGAIVTDSGGLLSHSAIVAREYGIPGVVGTRDATQRIPDGSWVRVDGDSGEVSLE
jgi:pyruvate,water dikinase